VNADFAGHVGGLNELTEQYELNRRIVGLHAGVQSVRHRFILRGKTIGVQPRNGAKEDAQQPSERTLESDRGQRFESIHGSSAFEVSSY
jgi:hypothetical protein